MVKSVILARERKRRARNRKILFLAIFALLWGVAVYFIFPGYDDAQQPPATEYLETKPSDPSAQQPVTTPSQSVENPATAPAEQPSVPPGTGTETAASSVDKEKPSPEEDPNATSYYDDLDTQDDEVEPGSVEQEQAADGEQDTEFLPEEAQTALDILLDVADQAWRINNQFSETVVAGQQLKDILEQSGLQPAVSVALIQSFPELKTLKAGQQFYWILNKDDQLEYMNWLVSDKEERIYERQADGSYKQQVLKKQSVWKTEVIKGQIQGSFSNSMSRHGLSARQINQLATALQWQVSMNKLRKGDKFAILMQREYLGDKLTGQAKVDAIHILHGGKSYYAIQAANGAYFNVNGETLGRGFARYPLTRQPKISSHFNPARRHPVTGRVSPHKGVDFSLRVGTPIIAPSDGEVVKVAYQANGAGRYIVLKHGRNYKTVYMHLSRALVKPGQQIKRGERIALSGNTGRSTGPHLHYEFHINDRPVNPMTVKLPGNNTGLPAKERKAFLTKSKEVVRKLKL
ncbi:murein DD-endopeptidase MepM [Testudinibacter aquarius]|uniref:Murein DD-endopeptidase MepM n=1 Tax=Testudinibacter aquarius TaxID=1524974 RepID=A0ABY2XU92_9PAST|nr:murein DD-endopeptidase MepM [Testudinibacter aquarius]